MDDQWEVCSYNMVAGMSIETRIEGWEPWKAKLHVLLRGVRPLKLEGFSIIGLVPQNLFFKTNALTQDHQVDQGKQHKGDGGPH